MTTRMTAAELRRWRLTEGLTQAQAAAWYGITGPHADRTWRRYERGDRPVPTPLAKRIREHPTGGTHARTRHHGTR